jgi:hypothetical protein
VATSSSPFQSHSQGDEDIAAPNPFQNGAVSRCAGRAGSHRSVLVWHPESCSSNTHVMGAYQYYEFQAVDRPLGRDEMEILRGFSTRARITSTSFTNEYSYGDFKGNADLEPWVAGLPVAEKDEFLVRLMKEGGSAVGIELRKRLAAERSPAGTAVSGARRSVRELLDAADRVRHAREEAEARKAEEARAQIQREAAAAQSRRLEVLATRIPATWTRIGELIQSRQEKSYAEAVQLLGDLKELDQRRRLVPDFGRRLADIRAIHARKRTFIEQLASQGL